MFDIEAYVANFEDAIKTKIPVKQNWIDVRDAMIVHTRGVLPKKLLELKRPNEPKDLQEYRLANYRRITKKGINQAIDSIIRTFISSNYSIKYSDNLSEYIQKKRFTLQDEKYFLEPLTLLQLIIEHITRINFDDPNGILVWMPVNPNDYKLPPSQIAENEKIEIEPMIVDSPRVIAISDDHLVFEAKEKVMVKTDARDPKAYCYYFIITREVILRMMPEYNSEKKKVVYVPYEWYSMGYSQKQENRYFPFLPCKVLGGNICINEHGHKYFESWFQSYVEFGNEAITSFSDNQAVRVRFNFPFASVKAEQCPKCKGAKKVHSDKEGNLGTMVTCDQCQGVGAIVPFSPFGTHYRKPPSSSEPESFSTAPAYEFYSPDVAILNASFEAWQKFLEMAEDSVNLTFTKEAQSGVAKEIDRENKHDTMFKVSSNTFDLLKFSLDCIECYLMPFQEDRKLEDNQVRQPTTFIIKSQDDLYAELNDLITKNAPTPFINTIANNLAQKVFNGDKKTQKIIEVLTIWDTLFGRSDADIGQLKATGAIGNTEIFRHVYGYSILYQVIDNPEEEIETIILAADAKLKPLIPVRTPLTNANGIPTA